ncbi:hypothetical protein VPH35_017064 [Triticum aestivum]|uniref:Aminotransferase-like plant mobile domain-containing protein n=1 Tax=Aegilops tauschii TaxID=37682 RepID=M8C2N3_AEGTA
MQQYTRAYLWYVVSRALFSDGTGVNASFMWLKLFAGWEHGLSWGMAALAYLYCQLDEACRRGANPRNVVESKEGNIGGPMLLLSIWSWEHLPVGRPTPKGYDPWDDHDDQDRMPTWAYKWDKVEGFVGNSKTMYLHYCNELDIMTPEQVILVETCFVFPVSLVFQKS